MSFFLQLVSMSLHGGLMILAVIILRGAIWKAPRKWSYFLWLAPALRLVCPVGIRSFHSLYLLLQLQPEPVSSSGTLSVLELSENTARLSDGVLPVPESGFSLKTTVSILAILWACGVAALLIIGIIRFIRMKKRLKNAEPIEKDVLESDGIRAPIVHGFFTPKIYLPEGLNDHFREVVLAHERFHIWRRDYLVKPIAYLLLMVHWFNPLVWVAFYLMSSDMEMCCDEAVLTEYDESGKSKQAIKTYSLALLALASCQESSMDLPTAFGSVDVKRRIKRILNWKKAPRWIAFVLAPLVILFIAGCMLHPTSPELKSTFMIQGVSFTKEDFRNECCEKYVGPLGIDNPIFKRAILTTSVLEIKENTISFRCKIECEGTVIDRFDAVGTIYEGYRKQVSEARSRVLDIKEEENLCNILLFEMVEGPSQNNYYLPREETAESSIRVFFEVGEQLYLFEAPMPELFLDCFQREYVQVDDALKDMLWFARFVKANVELIPLDSN